MVTIQFRPRDVRVTEAALYSEPSLSENRGDLEASTVFFLERKRAKN